MSVESYHNGGGFPSVDGRSISFLLPNISERSGAYELFYSTLFDTMVTYEALFAFCMLIIAVIALIKDNKK